MDEPAGEFHHFFKINSAYLQYHSGKSSLALVLLRLLDPLSTCSDRITIDNIPLHLIDRSILRSRLISIPQDTFFFPDGSSFKLNLDPDDTASHAESQAVLEEVGLWNLINDRGGLDKPMKSEMLSQGQKQLFSLARAVLRVQARTRIASAETQTSDKGEKRKCGGILLLDEISSSVDGPTDVLMQAIIRREFAGYTILAIAHRLNTVLDFDRAIILEKGAIIACGPPRSLLGKDVPGVVHDDGEIVS